MEDNSSRYSCKLLDLERSWSSVDDFFSFLRCSVCSFFCRNEMTMLDDRINLRRGRLEIFFAFFDVKKIRPRSFASFKRYSEELHCFFLFFSLFLSFFFQLLRMKRNKIFWKYIKDFVWKLKYSSDYF